MKKSTCGNTEQAGEILKIYRLNAGMSTRKAAEGTDHHYTTIGKIENGQRRVDVREYFQLVRKYGVSNEQALADLAYRGVIEKD